MFLQLEMVISAYLFKFELMGVGFGLQLGLAFFLKYLGFSEETAFEFPVVVESLLDVLLPFRVGRS